MTSLCPVLAGYKLVRSEPCSCLSSMCIQNLLNAHSSTVVGMHSLSSVLDHFLVSFSFMACLIRGWALLDGGFCFFFSPPFLLLSLAIPLHRSCCKVVLLQIGWAFLGLPFILPLMAQQSHWFLCYIVSRLPCPICFPLGFLGHFPIFALPWAFIEFFGIPWPNYIIPHPWGSWACHKPLTFFVFITLGLSWPILTFPHHILPMVCFFLSFRAPLSPFTSLRPICLSHGPVIYYSCYLGLMGFLSVCQLLFVFVAGLLLPTWASKMAFNI